MISIQCTLSDLDLSDIGFGDVSFFLFLFFSCAYVYVYIMETYTKYHSSLTAIIQNSLIAKP